jgi:hypothetical protein
MVKRQASKVKKMIPMKKNIFKNATNLATLEKQLKVYRVKIHPNKFKNPKDKAVAERITKDLVMHATNRREELVRHMEAQKTLRAQMKRFTSRVKEQLIQWRGWLWRVRRDGTLQIVARA